MKVLAILGEFILKKTRLHTFKVCFAKEAKGKHHPQRTQLEMQRQQLLLWWYEHQAPKSRQTPYSICVSHRIRLGGNL